MGFGFNDNNKEKINAVIPMVGMESLFSSCGFSTDKYLLPIDKHLTKMIEGSLTSLGIDGHMYDVTFIFVIHEECDHNIDLRKELLYVCDRYKYKIHIISVDESTEGPASTVYLAKEFIDNDTPLIISNADQYLRWSFRSFFNYSMNYDATVLTYSPDCKLTLGDSDDKHTFVRKDENNVPVQFAENTVISDEALVGVYFYKKGKYFIQSYNHVVSCDMRAPDGKFSVFCTYQALAESGKNELNDGYLCEHLSNHEKIKKQMPFLLSTWKLQEYDHYHQLGEPIHYFEYYNIQNPVIKTPKLEILYSTKVIKEIIENTIKNKIRTFEETQYFREWILPTLSKSNDILNHIRVDCINDTLGGKEVIFTNEIVFVFNPDNNMINYQLFYSGKYCDMYIPSNTMIMRISNIYGGGNYRSIANSNCTKDDGVKDLSSDKFNPFFFKTSLYEIEILKCKSNEKHIFHYHKISTEINLLLKGKMKINGCNIFTTQIFICEPKQIICCEFLEDCEILCIKIPCVNDDDTYVI